jgi:hypothetical protein
MTLTRSCTPIPASLCWGSASQTPHFRHGCCLSEAQKKRRSPESHFSWILMLPMMHYFICQVASQQLPNRAGWIVCWHRECLSALRPSLYSCSPHWRWEHGLSWGSQRWITKNVSNLWADGWRLCIHHYLFSICLHVPFLSIAYMHCIHVILCKSWTCSPEGSSCPIDLSLHLCLDVMTL